MQSFEPRVEGVLSDTIVTVAMPPEVPNEMPFTADTRISSPSGSIRSSFYSAVSFIAAGPDDFSDKYWFSGSYHIASRNGKFDFGIGKESNQGLFPLISSHS